MTDLISVTRLLAACGSTLLEAGWAFGVMLLFALALRANATTYYVSSSSGNDANGGTSAVAAWQTIGHVNGQTFQPGDSVLFKRGDAWNESLAPPSSGSSGNPITFDAYGTGKAPNLTGWYAVPTSAWVNVTGNAWKVPLPATYTTVNFCLFGSVWGQKVPAATSNLTAQWDFYLANGYLYVYSQGNPGSWYTGPIVPMALSNVPVINVNGKSWLTFQHFLINWFDDFGIYVQGASDHLVFANMEADSMIPQGTQPLGFYVNESAPGPGDIKIYNSEVLLDQKTLPNRAPFVERSAGSVLKQLAQDLLPGGFNTSAVQDVDTLAAYQVNPEKKFSLHAGEIALAARASYRAMNGALALAAVGAATYAMNEGDPNFSPMGLKLESPNLLANDVTVIGLIEPQAYVRDYFVGDGLSLRFFLSQKPFAESKPALIDEEYLGPGLDPTTWVVNDPASAISVVAQTMQVNGGTGTDGQTTAEFIQQIGLGGALELKHGDVSFAAASQGVIGGLYAGAVSAAGCLAGFQVTPSGAGSNIQGLIQGAPTGPVIATAAGHRYVLTTYLYSMEVYRSQETFHSSVHPSGSGRGGAAVAANVRVVLELQDIDPSNPTTLIAPATVLYDGVISSAPGFCTYALVNAMNMLCSIAYTYVAHISLAEVRTALPNASYVTQLVGSISDGAECEIAGTTTLDFYPQYVPALNTLIVASYRGSGRAAAEVINSASVVALQHGADNGTRGIVKSVKIPSTRTQADCENAALAILDDAVGAAWLGSYETWSDFLPGAASDVFPGDELVVNIPSRSAVFSAIVRKVTIDVANPAGDRGIYTIEFANDLAQPLAMQEAGNAVAVPLQNMPLPQATTQVGSYYLQNLTEAQITQVSSTTVSVDAGISPPNGWGIEVRVHDFGWGVANDRNLLGRFSTQTFTLPRWARTQNYFLRLYDNSSPPKYSRYSAALHVDYPLS